MPSPASSRDRNTSIRSAWYEQTVFNIHFDHHAGETSPIGASCDPKKIKRLLRLSRPGMVQYHSKGHPGYATYPTKIGVPAKGLKRDVLRIYRDVTRELGIRFSIYNSSLYDMVQAKLHPEWVRKLADGKPRSECNGSALCCNSGYVDQIQIPMMREMAEWYQPDAFWLDGDVWSVAPCWCPECRKKFKTQTGDDPPIKSSDPKWPAWQKFHRDSFVEFHRRTANAVCGILPSCLFCGNWAYTLRQPDEAPDHIDWLSGDVHPAHGPRHASFEARFLQWRNRPCDIMTWNNAYNWGKTKAQYKSTQHLLQEGAVILANGMRWFIWDNPTPGDDLVDHAHQQMAELAKFAYARKDLVLGTTSVPWVAVLHGQTAHYAEREGMSFGWGGGQEFPALRGLCAALAEEGIHFDILNEETLIRRAEKYRLIVLAGQDPLANAVADALRNYVHSGGRLLVLGNNGLNRGAQGKTFFALEDLIGATYEGELGGEAFAVGAEEVDGGVLGGFRGDIFAASKCLRVKPKTATVKMRFQKHYERKKDINNSGAEQPAVLENRFGSGICTFVAADVTMEYDQNRYPPLRAWLGRLIRSLAGPLVEIVGEKQIEVTVRERGKDWIVHLVNLMPGKELDGNDWFVEKIPPRGPLTVRIACARKPVRVQVEPDGARIKWKWTKGCVGAVIPQLHIHCAVVLSGVA
jgi:hypothetical protein